jgi:RHS repeat-associated protein
VGYPATNYPFSVKKTEASPRHTVLEQGAPGADWQPHSGDYLGHTIKIWTRPNRADENIIIWDGNGQNVGNYQNGTLMVTKTVDENGHESWVYKNRAEQTILKVSNDGERDLQTYYVYDNYGNLRFIYPPGMMENYPGTALGTLQARWATEFTYDDENRLIKKKLPEAAALWTIYDRLGRVALTQDGNLREKNQWMFTKYDRYGRGVVTGVYTNTKWTKYDEMRDYVQDDVWQDFALYESPNSEANSHYYTDQAFPSLVDCQVWSVNYYDDYDLDGDGTDDVVYETRSGYPDAEEAFGRLIGSKTYGKVRVLEDGPVVEVISGADGNEYSAPFAGDEVYIIGNEITLKPGFRSKPGQKIAVGPNITAPPADQSGEQWLSSYSFVDKYGRTIQAFGRGHLGDDNRTFSRYDFAGKLREGRSEHSSDFASLTLDKRIVYDDGNRIIETHQKIDDGSEYQVSGLDYNELGTVVRKSIHNEGTGFLQDVDSDYNVRGWLEKINGGSLSTGNSDLFAMRLYYNSYFHFLGAPRQFNGNISSMSWQTKQAAAASPGTIRGMGYRYDNLGQIIAAQHGLGSEFSELQDHYRSAYSYDANGNILSLSRAGDSGALIDDLQYTYDTEHPNRLQKVDDAVSGSARAFHFVDYGPESNTAVEYEYDANGNMIVDKNKDMRVTYNELNLPTRVEFGAEGENRIEWLYGAGGGKLRKTVVEDGAVTLVKDYSSGYVYTNEALDYFRSENGRIRKTASGYTPEYHLTDHLGNVRVAFEPNGSGGLTRTQEQHYYPFGMELPGLSYDGGVDNEYRYNGKEHVKELDLHWYHYGARFYDPQLGRWHVVDPLEHLYPSWSPYQYALNSPIRNQDKDGEVVETVIDIISVGLSAYEFYENPTWENAGWLLADIGGAVIPFVPSVGAARHLAKLRNLTFFDEAGKALKLGSEVWKLPPMRRGEQIEKIMKTVVYEAEGWAKIVSMTKKGLISKVDNFPIFDFQKGNALLSLKSVDPSSPTAIYRMRKHINEIADSGAVSTGIKFPKITGLIFPV